MDENFLNWLVEILSGQPRNQKQQGLQPYRPGQVTEAGRAYDRMSPGIRPTMLPLAMPPPAAPFERNDAYSMRHEPYVNPGMPQSWADQPQPSFERNDAYSWRHLPMPPGVQPPRNMGQSWVDPVPYERDDAFTFRRRPPRR